MSLTSSSTLPLPLSRSRWVVPIGAVAGLLLAFLGWKVWQRRVQEKMDAAQIRALVDSEETYLLLGPRLGEASKALLDLRLPSAGKPLFADTVTVRDLVPTVPPSPSTDVSVPLARQDWPVAESTVDVPLAQLRLWQPLLGGIEWFEHARVYHITGQHPAGDLQRFEAKGGFEALARLKSGGWQSIHGKLKLSWAKLGSGGAQARDDWRITRWETTECHLASSPERLFADVMEQAVPAEEQRALLRQSDNEAAAVKYYLEGEKSSPHPYFAPISSNHKPGVSVADIDGDGFDDIYITVRIGKNKLLRNRGDGTFSEESALRGLDLPGHTTSTLFADFDNDGDLDALLGRSLLKAAYLENTGGGHFSQHKAPAWFPMATVSMAAADFNKDGLLDVYLCTYRPAAPIGTAPSGGVAQISEGSFDWPDEFFPPTLAAEYKQQLKVERNRQQGPFPNILDQMGPPNVLLINRGAGKFEPAPDSLGVNLWRNSFQASWGDYDQDGDPDLYIANDWAHDNLLRNDGEKGFRDVTQEAGITSYGFAMGASWGDYDNDGRDDVYVSNMYSKAGLRITGQLGALRNDLRESAQGNWLYRQSAPGKFEQVGGLEPPALLVGKAGWSWGGKFSDFDNDGWLDLYVLSGYFTAPKQLSSELDL